MTLLALIRHGPTAWNRERRVQGRRDIPLDAAGVAEVACWKLPPAFSSFDWAASPLCRARRTAAILAGAAVPCAPALVEMDWGEWEGRRLAELRAELGPEMAENEARGLDFLPPGGESPRMVQRRLAPWLGEVARRGRPTVAVAHRGVIRALYAAAAGWDMLEQPPRALSSPAAHLFEVTVDGRPRVRSLDVQAFR